uniref:Glycoside hydrolase family 5 n=1 Tax=uncultured bacterium contig00037 TaxID=1181525 RepID=A0A806JY26_9BACT|nr:glycoside hydrolase family 5 [uncultured bacterium contig00037]
MKKKFSIRLLVIVLAFTMAVVGCDNGSTNNNGNEQNSQTPDTPQPFRDITAMQLVSEIKAGWNLGNTFEAAHMTWLGSNPTVTQMETGWGNPVTTKAMIDAVKNAGFNAIRIPVTWLKAAGGAPNYTIRADWMTRITEVVNYAVANDMYIFLNTHHDEEDRYDFSNSGVDASLVIYKKVWEQIAANFKNYNEKLIFEGLNEPRTVGSANEWSGGTAEERANLNKYYQAFVDTVRPSGGNNDKRILMINTYGAFSGAAAVNAVVLPTDPKPNKIIVTIHGYVPYNFAYPESTTTWSSSNPSDTNPVLGVFQPAYDKFVSQGIPVVIGEFGTVSTNHNGTTNSLTAREDYTEYYVTQAKAKGIKCVIFDNNLHTYNAADSQVEIFGLLNRSNNTWTFPTIIAALMRGAESGGTLPGDTPLVVNNPVFTDAWGTDGGTNKLQADAQGWFNWTADTKFK